MDQDVTVLLKRYEAMQETFATIGWRCVVDEAQTEIEAIKDQLLSAHPDSVRFLQGRVNQLDMLIYLEDTVDNAKRALQEDGGDADVRLQVS